MALSCPASVLPCSCWGLASGAPVHMLHRVDLMLCARSPSGACSGPCGMGCWLWLPLGPGFRVASASSCGVLRLAPPPHPTPLPLSWQPRRPALPPARQPRQQLPSRPFPMRWHGAPQLRETMLEVYGLLRPKADRACMQDLLVDIAVLFSETHVPSPTVAAGGGVGGRPGRRMDVTTQETGLALHGLLFLPGGGTRGRQTPAPGAGLTRGPPNAKHEGDDTRTHATPTATTGPTGMQAPHPPKEGNNPRTTARSGVGVIAEHVTNCAIHGLPIGLWMVGRG
jgi:hypothetical protein